MIRTVLLLLWAAAILAAQDPYAARWADLRRRIREGGAQDLLRKWDVEDRAERKPLSDVHRRPAPHQLSIRREQVRSAACAANVPPDLVLAIFETESGFSNEFRGSQQEIGTAQILPSTAATFRFDMERLAADTTYNIRAGVSIIRSLLDQFDGDEQAAIRGYNGGPGWRMTGSATLHKIEDYAAVVNERRSKYVHLADCN